MAFNVIYLMIFSVCCLAGRSFSLYIDILICYVTLLLNCTWIVIGHQDNLRLYLATSKGRSTLFTYTVLAELAKFRLRLSWAHPQGLCVCVSE